MKLSPLLSRFLYANKYLKLSGIGKFTINEFTFPVEELSKLQKGMPTVKIDFEQDISVKDDDALISFISLETGKMKSLAAADLDSNMELARQFLNIGKPFLLEGIGTLSKNKAGDFEFIQEINVPDKMKESAHPEANQPSTTEDSFTDYEEMFSPKKPATPIGKKLTVALIIILGLGLAVWGGYKLYNNTRNKEAESLPTEVSNTPTVPVDTTTFTKDSIQPTVSQGQLQSPGTYKFVIEESYKERALKRYSDLLSYGLDIKMDTKDSVTFKLYFLLPASPADTAHIRDSLSLLYSTRGKAKIEL